MKLKQFIFALVAMLSCFGFTANAQVATVGNTEYATIDEAIAAWSNNTTLTLLSDVTLSDVVTLKSTEHHILNLGTYTMTAAKGKNAFVIKAYGTGDSERTAITINADATNPGGINAGSKCVVYYKYADGGISTNDRPIIKINGGVFTGTTSTWGTAGIYTIGTEARKCATLNISGGTFNCSINGSGKSKLIISGGVFNYSVGSQGDKTAYRLISGGKFKTLGFMTADNNNTKFWFGTSMANSNVGLYVDDEGYLCVGGPVITELGPKYKAVASNATKWSSYLAYSSAATYGLYYTNAEAAIKKHGAANVTVWEKPAVTIPEDVTGDATVVEEIKNNTALNDYTPENLPEGAELEIELKSVGETIVYDVTPMANGAVVEPTQAITFRLPVPASVTNAYAKVYHEGTLMGLYTIKGEGNAKYVEISSANFSVYTVEPTTPVAKIGETAYATLSAAFAAVTNDNQTVVICKDVTEELTGAYLRGNITTENEAKVTITLTNSDWVSCPYTFVIGENVTLKVPALFYYAGGAQINGTVIADAYYQRYANTKLTINEPGSMTVTGETCIIRYMDGDPDAGIYINGDNNPETVGLKLLVAYFYQGMINAKNANIQAGVYWQTNETDGQGSANLFLDNSTLNVTVNEHDFKATGNSTVTLQNNSSINVAGSFVAGDNTTLNVDATSAINDKNGEVAIPAAKIGTTKYATLDEAFAAATEGQTITLLADATPALTSQRAITKAAVIELGGKTMTLTEDDLYFGTTTFQNGTIVVDPSVKPSTAVFWMFANQTLTFDNVKVVATGVTGTYLIGLDGDNSDLNLLNGSEILVENTTALDLDIICVNASTGNDIKVENSKVNVTNLDGRVFFRGNYTVKDSEVNLAGITKAGFRIEAGQTLSIEGTSKVNIAGELRDGGIHMTDLSATYTKAETATVNATVNRPSVVQIGENKYSSLADAIVAAKAGDEIVMLADVTLDAATTLPADIIFNGNGKQINGNLIAGGNLTFKGATKVTSFSAGYYNRVITIGEGASLEITGTGRVTLGYGNTFNITGSIENAKIAGKENVQPSLIIPAGISITGGNDATMNVTNAYVKIGSTTSKPGAANGTFTLNFNNSIAEFTKEFGFYEPTGGMNPTFNMNITSSVFTTGTKLCVAAPNSNVIVDNSGVTLGTYFRNSGNVTIQNGSELQGKTIQFGENGGNNGTITVVASSLTVTADSEGHAFDGKGVGKIILKNEGTATLDYVKDMSIETVAGYKVVKEGNTYKAVDATVYVANKSELTSALTSAEDGAIIRLTADIDYGTDQLAIAKAITLDLGGKVLTTRNAYGGMSIKNNPTVKNGTIVHASNTAAIKVWNATAFEDLVIDVQGKGDANKTIGGIVLQSGSTTRVGSIKNVTIKGAALTNGIETYNCGDATENVIGAMENVTIDAQGTGLLISAPCGTATNCDIKGGVNGVEIFIKGNYSASLDLVSSKVEGGVYAHDEISTNPDIVNNGTLKFTADEATTGAAAENVTLEIARAEKVEGLLEDIKNNAQAKANNVYYATLQEAIKAAAPAGTVELLADITVDKWITISETLTIGDGTIVTLEMNGLTIDGNGHTLTIKEIESPEREDYLFHNATELNVKDLTISCVSSDVYDGGISLMSGTIENVTFNGGKYAVLPGANGVTVTGCTFNGTTGYAIYYEEAREGIVVNGNTFETSEGAYAITMRSNEKFTNNTIIKGKVNIANSSSATVTGNNFGTERFKVYNAASATITGNTINVLAFNDESVMNSTFADNTLSEEAQTLLNASKAYGKQAKIGDTYYATLAEAIAASTPETGWGGEVTLLKDVTLEGGYADAGEGLRIEKSVTINGGGYTIDCGTFTKGIRIYQNGDLASNVMFKHTNIVNNNNQGRCIDTRSGKINLMFNGGVNLTAHGTNSQPLTIGGSEAMTKVTISGGTIDAGTSGYAVICFVPVTNHINVQGNAVIKGLAAFYLKEGVTNTAIKLSQSTSIGTNKYAAASGDFGAIVIEGSNNGVRLEHSGAVVKAVAADGAEMAAQAAFLLRGDNNTVGYYNNANAQVVTEGGQAYWTLSKADVTGTKYERNGVEMLLEAETRGYQFITVEDALRYAKNGDSVKLLANAELDETYVNEKSLTLDLNGKTLSTAYVAGSTTNHLYAIQNNAELTITDSSDAKDGKISARGNFNYGTLTLEAGTIEAIDGNGGYAVRNYAGSFTMNGGTIATTLEDDNKVDKGGYDATTVRVDEGATFTMNGGVINNICDYTFAIENYGTTTVEGGEATSVHTTVANYGTINIEGGEFVCNGLEGITAHAVWAAEGTTNISGGTFDGKDNYNGFNVCASKGANVVITGGNFLDVHSGSLYGDGTITVSGGTFFDKISDQRCEIGFQAVVNTEGTYDVKLTNKRDAYTIEDGKISKYDNSAEIKLGTFTYKRNLLGLDEDGKYKWSPLYLPVQIPVDSLLENYDVAYINDIHSFDNNEDGEIDKMTIEYIKIKTGTLKANYPYVIRPKNEEARTWNLVLTDVVLYPNDENTIKCSSVFETFTIGGTYHTMTGEELAGKLSIKGNGNWENNEASYTLNPLRLHMSIERDGTPVIVDDTKMSIRIAVRGEDDLTDIDAVRNNNETNTLIFDLQGRRVLKPVKGGIYIINGKKVYFE